MRVSNNQLNCSRSFKSSILVSALLVILFASSSFFPLFAFSSLQRASSSQPSSQQLAGSAVQDEWLTYHNDNSRDGFSTTAGSINSPSVSWSSTVDGAVYAEPLYYNGLTYIATEGDTIYALNSSTGATVWSTHLGTPMSSVVPPLECGGNGPDIKPEIGVTGTPVIDPSSSTLFVAALINNIGYLLFALNANSGHENWYSSITTTGFHYLAEEQRGALALANGYVYVPFGGYSWNCVTPSPTGWVIAMSPNGAGAEHSFQVPTTVEGDIWAPEGVSVDSAGSVYVVTGDSNNATFDLGNSVIKLSPDLTFVDSSSNYFAAKDWQYTNENDLDLGSTGVTLLPGNLAFAIGKDGVGYLLSSANLGGIGGDLFSANVCAFGYQGAWGSTSYANGIIYVPCGSGLIALQLNSGSSPSFRSLWNLTGIFAGPPIIAGSSVWLVSIPSGTLYELNGQSGSVEFQKTIGTVEHFTTPSAGGGRIFVGVGDSVYAVGSSSSGGGTSDLVVSSENTNNEAITGYYTVLSGQNGNELASGFTPATFTLNNGATYYLQVDNYASCKFAYWLDTNSNNPQREISISSNIGITAVYNCGGGGSGSSVTVNSVNQNGNTINGYYVILYNSAGSVLGTGFTPKTFSVTSNTAYEIQADNYGSCVFAQWSNGMTSNPLAFTASGSPMPFTAVYNCGSSSGSSSISIATVNSRGSAINGYYTTLWQSGKEIGNCFSPCTFSAKNGQTYQVEVSNYGSESFSHWQNGSSARMYTVNVPDSATTIDLTAYYSP